VLPCHFDVVFFSFAFLAKAEIVLLVFCFCNVFFPLVFGFGGADALNFLRDFLVFIKTTTKA